MRPFRSACGVACACTVQMAKEVRRGTGAYISNKSLEPVGSCLDARPVCLEKHGSSRLDVDRAHPAAACKGEEPRLPWRIQVSETTGRKRETLEHESRAGDEQ